MSDFPQTADPVATMLGDQIQTNVQAIIEANEVLLNQEDSSAGNREIDKKLKELIAEEGKDLPEDADKDVVKAVAKMVKAKLAYTTALGEARNLYRTNVLHEDAVTETESSVDEDAVKEKRKVVMQAVTLLKSYAGQNGLADVEAWANNLAIPQVGRQGSSTVGGKKPRARVTVNGTTHETFGEAAKALTTLLSSDENKVTVTSNDLVAAWSEQGEKETFDFQGQTVRVTPKEKKVAA